MCGVFSVVKPNRKSAPTASPASSAGGITLQAKFSSRCAGAMTIERPDKSSLSAIRSCDHMPPNSFARLKMPAKKLLPVWRRAAWFPPLPPLPPLPPIALLALFGLAVGAFADVVIRLAALVRPALDRVVG